MKSQISIALDQDLLQRLNDLCKENFIVRSRLIEAAIKDYLQQKYGD